ncbi:MAG: glycosyltransferase [Burkholderiaceae bacterium]|nr:glycosyltransferase [Burkholderiaceae bacterium]
MQAMHVSEAEIIPYHASAIPRARAVLVFAPHPDDEVFGCGGALALHAQAGHAVHVVLLTDGGYPVHGNSDDSYARTRLKESAHAAQVLGVEAPQCWELQDRAVVYGEDLVERMRHAVESTGANVVYAPSPWELHPDHRATALAAIETARRLGGDLTLCLYEVSAPLRPNTLVDISPVWERKQAAMQVFASQEAKLPYTSFITALNRYRAFTLYPGTEHAEGFEILRAEQLRAGGPLLIEGERMRLLDRGVAVLPQDLPLVSIVIRTMGRPTLAQSLASVALQTYAHLEIVLVDAAGRGLPSLPPEAALVSCHLVSLGRPLPRAEAANCGMHAAKGEYLIFLDDDDWFYPDHIAKLVRMARSHPVFKAVHTAIECVDEMGEPQGEVFEFPYAPGELRYGNFLPIHSVLFHRSLLDAGCSFDGAFDLYEDWDFWLQVETHTPMGFVPGVSAAYRIQPGSGEGVRTDAQRARKATAQIYAKWKVMQSEQTFDELITRALSRRGLIRRMEGQVHLVSAAQKQALAAQQEADRSRQDAHHLRVAHDQACADRDAARQESLETSRQYAAMQQQWLQEYAQRLAADAAVASLEQEARRLSLELALTRDHASNVQASLDVTVRALESARADVSALLSSTSWRISKPVRAAGKGLRWARRAVAALQAARRQGLGWTYLAQRTLEVYRREGLAGVRMRAQRKVAPVHDQANLPSTGDAALASGHAAPERSYSRWALQYDTLGDAEQAALHEQLRALRTLPLISIVMPVYKPQADDVLRAIASVKAQIYPHWELCICDDASPDTATRSLLLVQAQGEPRIRLVFHDTNQHISAASNTAIAQARGEYIAFLDHDDELRPHALLNVVQALQARPEAQVLYSDEDKIDQHGRRFDPYFKPEFNLGLLRSHNYMCHFGVYRATLIRQLGGLRAGFEGAQDYDLALRAVDALDRRAVVRIPKILYHWRTAVGSTAAGHGNKSYAFEAGRRALAEHLQRRGLHGGIVEAPEAPGMYRVRWQRPDPAPLVSIIIPTRNGHDILKQCLDSLRLTAYPNYETIVIDNGSDDPATLELLAARSRDGQIRVQRDDSPFNFSALNNRAVRTAARGEFILLMNNDIEITHPEWLDEMVGPAMESGTGCVGARLWYPDGRLQHGGVVLVCGVAGHAHKLLPKGQHGYMGRAVLAQDFVAVTAACLLVRKSIYDEVHGLDETLAVAFNDVDFCLRVHEAGYRNHWTPYAELVHHESVTRGYEDTPEKQKRFKGEIDLLQSRWGHLLKNDPCYNPNLTADAEDFSLAWPPRVSPTSPPAP